MSLVITLLPDVTPSWRHLLNLHVLWKGLGYAAVTCYFIYPSKAKITLVPILKDNSTMSFLVNICISVAQCNMTRSTHLDLWHISFCRVKVMDLGYVPVFPSSLLW